MPPTSDLKVLAGVDRVLARNCSTTTATRKEFVAFASSKSQEALCCYVRKHVQKRRASTALAEAVGVIAGSIY